MTEIVMYFKKINIFSICSSVKQLSNIFEYINDDKILLNRYYDLTNLNLNNSSLIYLNEIIFKEFIKQIKQLNKYKFKLKYFYPSTTTPSPTTSSIEQIQNKTGINIKSTSSKPALQQSTTNNGFNLKTISKKFNIKSWFTSKQQQQQPQLLQNNKTTSKSSSIDNMKNSYSEPIINEFNVNFNPNTSKI
jgi:hypothetical protein